jgi:hypothetical protein
MAAHQEHASPAEPVERFRPTSGWFVGWTSMLVALLLIGYVAVTSPSLDGLRIVLGLAFAAAVVWATQLRPRATLYPATLELRNSFRDTTVPLARIDEVMVRRTLNVWVGGERYTCIGIGTPLRRMVKMPKSRGSSTILGFDRLEAYHASQTPPSPDQSAMEYATFVETRILDAVDQVRRDGVPGPREATGSSPHAARHTWAWPEISALGLTGLGFLVALLAG